MFSRTGSTRASFYRELPRGSLAALERAVADSPAFRLWYRNSDARIYAVVGRR